MADNTVATATTTEPKDKKYNITMTDALLSDVKYISGRLDIPMAQTFRDAVSFYRKHIEAGK